MNFFEELKRRNVIRVGLAYLVMSWLLVQIGDVLFEGFGAPDWVIKVLTVGLALGFVPALIFSWAFEITDEGIKRERDVQRDESITHVTARKLDIAVIVLLVAMGGFLFWQGQQAPAPIDAPVASVTTSSTAPLGEIDIDDKSIAVLPFVNLSSDPEQEFFSDGISEELLNVLAQFQDLRVAARTSSFQFKGDNRDISEIAQLLKVNHVLEGSVRKSGTRLRITAQLIEAGTGYHLWSQTYDRELEDVFAIQDEISLAIGDAMKVQLALEGAKGAAPKVPESNNTTAYEAFLKGRHLVNQRGNLAITAARRELEKSIRLDPNYAPAQAQLAIAIMLLHNDSTSYGDLSLGEVKRLATPHIDKALALDPELAEAQAALALMALLSEDYEAVVRHADAASRLNPSNLDVLNWKGIALSGLGRYRENLQVTEKMLDIDPLSVVGQMNSIGRYLETDRITDAVAMSDRLVKQHPWAGYASKINVASVEGKVADAVRWALLAYGENPLDRYSNERLARNLAVLGLVDEARRVSASTLLDAELWSGNYTAALSEALKQQQLDTENESWVMTQGWLNIALGNTADGMQLMEQWLETQPEDLSTQPHHVLLMLANGYLLLDRQKDAQTIFDAFDRNIAQTRDAHGTERGTFWARGQMALLQGDEGAFYRFTDTALKDELRSQVLLRFVAGDRVGQDERFQAFEVRLAAILEQENAKVLETICRNNPIPDTWQPLPETCATVSPVANI